MFHLLCVLSLGSSASIPRLVAISQFANILWVLCSKCERGHWVFPSGCLFLFLLFFMLFLYESVKKLVYTALRIDSSLLTCLPCDFKLPGGTASPKCLHSRFECLAHSIPRMNVKGAVSWEVNQWYRPRNLMKPSFVCVWPLKECFNMPFHIWSSKQLY